MQKHFYSHIIEIDSVYTVLDLMDMTDDEKKELIIIVDSTVHHVIIDTVLSELSDEDKRRFLSHLHAEKHDDIWQLLYQKIKNIETKIRKAVDKLKKEFHTDIKKSKAKKETPSGR